MTRAPCRNASRPDGIWAIELVVRQAAAVCPEDTFGHIDFNPTTSQRTATTWYVKDHLGSIRALVNEAGQVIATCDYSPWGVPRNATGDFWKKSRLGFTGREQDPETGLVYLRARYYSPELGRFISPDPLLSDPRWLMRTLRGRASSGSGVNAYAYAINNPLRYTDPLGLDPIWDPRTQEWGSDTAQTGDSVPRTEESEPWAYQDLPELGEFIDAGVTVGCLIPPIGAGGMGASAIVKGGVLLSEHAVKRMAERGITEAMVGVALRVGKRFWDPKNKTIQYVIEGGFASGKSLLVGQNPVTKIITTVERGTRLVRPRFNPLK